MKDCRNCKHYKFIRCADYADGTEFNTPDTYEECPVRGKDERGYIVRFNGDYRPCINYEEKK
jgi:hypothetical protein